MLRLFFSISLSVPLFSLCRLKAWTNSQFSRVNPGNAAAAFISVLVWQPSDFSIFCSSRANSSGPPCGMWIAGCSFTFQWLLWPYYLKKHFKTKHYVKDTAIGTTSLQNMTLLILQGHQEPANEPLLNFANRSQEKKFIMVLMENGNLTEDCLV